MLEPIQGDRRVLESIQDLNLSLVNLDIQTKVQKMRPYLFFKSRTKITIRATKDFKILIFKVIFQSNLGGQLLLLTFFETNDFYITTLF